MDREPIGEFDSGIGPPWPPPEPEPASDVGGWLALMLSVAVVLAGFIACAAVARGAVAPPIGPDRQPLPLGGETPPPPVAVIELGWPERLAKFSFYAARLHENTDFAEAHAEWAEWQANMHPSETPLRLYAAHARRVADCWACLACAVDGRPRKIAGGLGFWLVAQEDAIDELLEKLGEEDFFDGVMPPACWIDWRPGPST